MTSLPSNTFLFNYNVREMISEHSYYIIPQNVQQLYNGYIYLDGSGVTAHTEEGWAHINYAYNGIHSENLFNRDSNNSSFTFIYKTANFNSGNTTLFANSSNYRVKPTAFQTADSDFLSLTPNSNPQICLIRVYSDGRSERKFLDAGGNVLQSTSSSTINWGDWSEMSEVCFFGTDYSSEIFDADFYWMYCSTETLTDAEVLQVIQYNEGIEPTESLLVPKNNIYREGRLIN